MDDNSPHTMIARSLKDLSRFINSGSGGKSSSPWDKMNKSPRMQLSFSEDEPAAAERSCKRKSEDHASQSVKRQRDSVTGLDVCRLLRDKDSELVLVQTEVTSLKGLLSEASTAHTKLKLEYDTELSQLRLAKLRDKEQIDELNLKLKNEKQSSVRFKEEYDQAKLEKKKLVASLQDSLASSTAQLKEQVEQWRQEASSLRDQLSTTEKKLEGRNGELDVSESEVSSLRDEVQSQLKQVRQLREELLPLQDLQLQLNREQATVRELQSRLQTVSAQEQLADSFVSSVQRLPELERKLSKLTQENEMYKACSANTRLLEEQVASAVDQITRLEERCAAASQTQADLDHAKSQASQLHSVLRTELSLENSPEPEELRSLLKALRSSDHSLTDSITALRDSISSHEKQKEALEGEVKSLRDIAEQRKSQLERQVFYRNRIQRKLLLVTKERNSLKDILTSYEAEATMTAATATGSVRIATLEASLSQCKEELTTVEKALDLYERGTQLPGDKELLSKSGRTELKRLQEEVQKLEEQVSKLQEEKEVLEYRLDQRALKGDYDPSQVNVLHMKENPMSLAESQYQSEVSKLEEEVRQLKSQLTLAQQGNTSQLPEPVEVQAADRQAVQELEKEVKSMEVKHQRLIEAFKSKSKEMREVVYRLMGYLVMPAGEDNCYKLSSMYAESQDDYFMFELASNGDIRLLSTDFSNSLEDLIDAYLNQENSYPAFLSAVTIDLFGKQTMLARPPSPGGSEEQLRREEQEGEEEEMEDSDSEEAAEEQEEDGSEEEEEEEEDDDQDEENEDRAADDDDDDLICLD